jgi:hypothetical protein
MAAVETIYGDHRFHSRLAARWAVFFDMLDIKFKYRPNTFCFTDLGNREWTPDFCLPKFGIDRATDDLATCYLSTLERKPSKLELETGCHLAESNRSEPVYFFPGGIGEGGLQCWQYFGRANTTNCEFAQCPFCGALYIAEFRAEDTTKYFHSHNCVEEYEFAERYGIDASFLDFTRKGEDFPLPTEGPMLQIARRAAKTVRFDSPESLAVLRGMRESAETLSLSRVFASPDVMHWITSHAARLAADENCPRFDGNRPYIIHAKHKRSGSRKPCPCETCQSKRPEVSKDKLSDMKAPERRM